MVREGPSFLFLFYFLSVRGHLAERLGAFLLRKNFEKLKKVTKKGLTGGVGVW